MKLINKLGLLAVIALAFSMSGCDKTKPYDVAVPNQEKAHFVGEPLQRYSIVVNPPPVYNVVMGTTNVTGTDRTYTYNVTSPSGAIPGTHYTIATGNTTGTVVIPAGEAVANIPVQADYALYQTGRRDTLIFTLSEPSKVPGFVDTLRLALRGPCFEGDVNVNDMLGLYANTIETFGGGAPYGPYPTTISSAVSTGPTTATIVVTNIWDAGWGPITFNLDWTNPAARTAIVVPQAAVPGSNAGDLNPLYNGQTVAVRGFAANPGTFSACNGTFTLRMQLGVTALGYFAPVYTVNMAR